MRLLKTYVKASLILSKHALSITWPQLGKIVFENFNRTTTSFVYRSESTTFPETKSFIKRFPMNIDGSQNNALISSVLASTSK